MREITTVDITRTVSRLCIEANCRIGDDVTARLRELRDREESPLGRDVLDLLLRNYTLAAQQHLPICQDTGVAVVFAEIGQDVHVTGGGFEEAIQEGVRQGYAEGYLRKSMVADPVFERRNTEDNTPAVIHTRLVPGTGISLTVAPKGAGAENMSEVRMLRPGEGIEGVTDFVVERVKRSGGNPCPPVVVGVGIGGNFEQCALLAKQALLRPLGSPHPQERWARVETDLLERVNRLGIGPQGFGGRITALAVHILHQPCHLAALPVAVNMQCHANRHATAML